MRVSAYIREQAERHRHTVLVRGESAVRLGSILQDRKELRNMKMDYYRALDVADSNDPRLHIDEVLQALTTLADANLQ